MQLQHTYACPCLGHPAACCMVRFVVCLALKRPQPALAVPAYIQRMLQCCQARTYSNSTRQAAKHITRSWLAALPAAPIPTPLRASHSTQVDAPRQAGAQHAKILLLAASCLRFSSQSESSPCTCAFLLLRHTYQPVLLLVVDTASAGCTQNAAGCQQP